MFIVISLVGAKSYLRGHIMREEIKLTILLQNWYKTCKTVYCWIYIDLLMLSRIDFSLSPLCPLLPSSVCACVSVHECVSIAKNINFTNISPRLLNTSNPLCCALSCYGGVTGCKAVSVIKSDRGAPSQTRTLSSPSRTQRSLSSEQLRTYLTFPDQPFCIIFQMTFSVTYFISDNGTLNLVKCIRAKCVYFGEGDHTDWQGPCSQTET